MPQGVSAARRDLELGSSECALDGVDDDGALQRSPDRNVVADKHVPRRRHWSSATEIGGDGTTDVSRQWQDAGPTSFAGGDREGPDTPIDGIKGELGHFFGAQAEV